MDTFSSKNSGVQIGYETELNREVSFSKGIAEGSVGTTQTIPPAYTSSESTEKSMHGKLRVVHIIECECVIRIPTQRTVQEIHYHLARHILTYF